MSDARQRSRAAARAAALYPPGFAAGTALAAYGVLSMFVGLLATVFAIAVAWPEWAAGLPPWRTSMDGVLDLTAAPMAVAGACMVAGGFSLRRGGHTPVAWAGSILAGVPLAGACWLVGAPLAVWCVRGCAAHAQAAARSGVDSR